MTSSSLPHMTQAVKRAIEEGDVIALDKFLKAGADPNMVEMEVESGKQSQHSALILAISLNQVEVAQLLIDAGADVDTIYMNYDSNNKCIYELSALATTRMLYEFTLSNSMGELLSTIEDKIRERQGEEPAKIFPVKLPKDVPNEVLIDSVREGDLDSVTLLLSHGMDVNLIHTDGESGYEMSILILAIIRGRCSVARCLLEKGADSDTVYLNYDDEEDVIIELMALSEAEKKIEKTPSRDMDAVINRIKDDLNKTNREPKVKAAKDIPKAKLELHPRFKKKVPKIFIATVNEDEIEEIKSWNDGSSESFSNERCQKYKEEHGEDNNKNGKNGTTPHGNKSVDIVNENAKDSEPKKKSTTCVLL